MELKDRERHILLVNFEHLDLALPELHYIFGLFGYMN